LLLLQCQQAVLQGVLHGMLHMQLQEQMMVLLPQLKALLVQLMFLLHGTLAHKQVHTVQLQQRVWQQKVQGQHELVAQLQQEIQQAESRFDPALPELQPYAWPP
jgi:uncharacterized membrane protein YjgN (DUF898 family)